MGARGAKYARAEHDIEKQVRKIADVYREVAQGAPDISIARKTAC
jgi:HAMP domain-containing protein